MWIVFWGSRGWWSQFWNLNCEYPTLFCSLIYKAYRLTVIATISFHWTWGPLIYWSYLVSRKSWILVLMPELSSRSSVKTVTEKQSRNAGSRPGKPSCINFSSPCCHQLFYQTVLSHTPLPLLPTNHRSPHAPFTFHLLPPPHLRSFLVIFFSQVVIPESVQLPRRRSEVQSNLTCPYGWQPSSSSGITSAFLPSGWGGPNRNRYQYKIS